MSWQFSFSGGPGWIEAGESEILSLAAAMTTTLSWRSLDAFMSGSYDLAYEGFVKLAEAGSSVSQYYLGMMFLNGKGVLQDFCEAHMWFNIASSRGHDKARKQLEKLTHGMVPEQVAEAQSQARHWVRMQNAGGDLVGK